MVPMVYFPDSAYQTIIIQSAEISWDLVVFLKHKSGQPQHVANIDEAKILWSVVCPLMAQHRLGIRPSAGTPAIMAD